MLSSIMRETLEQNPESSQLDLMMENIKLPRLRILKETHDGYRVQYGDEILKIAKDDTSHFISGGIQSVTMGMRMKLSQVQVLSENVFIGNEVPDEFREIVIFHELREIEYKDAGFDDAHNRAVHDEMLYALRYFSPEKVKEYMELAKISRKKARNKQLRIESRQRKSEIEAERERRKAWQLEEMDRQKSQQLQAEQAEKARKEMELEKAGNKIRRRENAEKKLQWSSPRIAAFWQEHADLRKELDDIVAMSSTLSQPVQAFVGPKISRGSDLFNYFYKTKHPEISGSTLDYHVAKFKKYMSMDFVMYDFIRSLRSRLEDGVLYAGQDGYGTYRDQNHILTETEGKYLSGIFEFFCELAVRFCSEKHIQGIENWSGVSLDKTRKKLSTEANMSEIEIWNIFRLKFFAFKEGEILNPLNLTLQKYQIEGEGEDSLPLSSSQNPESSI